MAYSIISTKISDYLAEELQHSDEKKEITAYAIENIINTIIGFIVIMALGFFLKAPLATFWTAMAGGFLRKLSGGLHCSTAARCIISGAVTYSVTGWLTEHIFLLLGEKTYYVMVLLAAGILCLVIVARYAPVDSAAKPIVSVHFRNKLRMLSILCVIFFIIIALLNTGSSTAPAVIGGLILQSVSLLPFLNRRGGGDICE